MVQLGKKPNDSSFSCSAGYTHCGCFITSVGEDSSISIKNREGLFQKQLIRVNCLVWFIGATGQSRLAFARGKFKPQLRSSRSYDTLCIKVDKTRRSDRRSRHCGCLLLHSKTVLYHRGRPLLGKYIISSPFSEGTQKLFSLIALSLSCTAVYPICQ